MKSPPRASCSNKRCHRFPGFAVRCPFPYTFLMGTVVLPQLSGKSRPVAGTFGVCFFYSVLITPISAPQCLHFIMKSGYRPIVGVTNCIFVSVPASIIFRPHSGHRTGRIPVFISCPCSSFFLRITYTLLPDPADVRRGEGI